ncbi:uncharacterized protein LOC144116251 [Amblyomma americanum]
MLRNLDSEQRQILLQQINLVWERGELPEDWRTAVVCPIRKPGRPPTDLNEYRPVALTSAAGDGAYPLKPWLITPIPGHSALRSVVERTIGVLKSQFRCLQRYRALHYEPEVAAKIVVACAVLHNVCIYARQPYLNTYDSDDPDGDTDQCEEEQEIPAFYPIGRSKREQLLQAFAHRRHR